MAPGGTDGSSRAGPLADTGEWVDTFDDASSVMEMSGMNVSSGTAELNLSGAPGAGYDAYPSVVFPDLVSNLHLFESNAAGDGYADGTTIAGIDATRGLDTDDLNGDGYLDLICARGTDRNNVDSSILWGSSSGTWSSSSKHTLNTADYGTDAAVGDFNGDGWKDVVVSCVGGMIGSSYLFMNNGDGTFDNAPDVTFQGIAAISVDAGDLDNDGYDDLIFTRSLIVDAPLYLGSNSGMDANSDGNFLREITNMRYIGEVLFEDIDEDGYLDVLFATKNDNGEAPIYMGSKTGVDTTADYKLPVSGNPMDVDVGDVNGDGYLDVVYSTQTNDPAYRLECFEGTSSGWDSSHTHVIKTTGAIDPVEVVDVDMDGYDDMLTGEGRDFKVYEGSKGWPTTANITKSGVSAPEDIAVGVPTGAGGTYTGSLVTEAIALPDGKYWDVLHLDADVPEGTEFAVSVLDSSEDVIPGFEKLTALDVDLSPIENWRSLHVRLELKSTSNASTPVVRELLVNWMPEYMWRDQFYGSIKAESTLGLDVTSLRLEGPTTTSGTDDLVFACLQGNGGSNVRSIAYVNPLVGGADALDIATTEASDVDAYDVDGDGVLELAFSSYGSSPGSYQGKSPVFHGSAAGWYGTPMWEFDTTGARGVAMDDLNGDGHADVVFAQERDWQGPNVDSLLFWGSAAGWNDTADVLFKTDQAFDVEVADVDGDGALDLVFACNKETHTITDSMVFLQDATGFCGTAPDYRLAAAGARAVATGDLDGDGNLDVVLANHEKDFPTEYDSLVFWGKDGGGFESLTHALPTSYASDVEVVDLDGDDDLDIVFANSRNTTGGYLTDSYIYLNDGDGGFASSPDARLPTDGAYGVAVADLDGTGRLDIVFACLSNATGYRVDSLAYLGGASGWSSAPDATFPTVGAIDVAVVPLDDPSRGGYLSRAITPDPEDDIGDFDHLRYEATMAAGVSGTVSIVDADSLEVLAEKAMGAGTQRWDVDGLFKLRLHPSVRIMVAVEGLASVGDVTLDDLWINWTERVPVAPDGRGLWLDDHTCYRGDSVYAWLDAVDEYDLESELTVRLLHKLVGEEDWGTFLVTETVYVEDSWRFTIAPDRTVPLGEYVFEANITDSDGLSTLYGASAAVLTVLPNLPGPPIIMDLTAIGGQVMVEWRAPLDEGDMAVGGYRVYRGEAEDDLEPISETDGFTTTYTDLDVVNGVTYHYAVQAFNALGNSTLSEVANATPLGGASVPVNISATAGNGTVTLSWEPPESDGGAPVALYWIVRGLTDDPQDPLASVAGTSFEDTGLVNGVTYYYRVRADNGVIMGAWTEVVHATPFKAPSAPLDVTLTPGDGRLTLSWSEPADLGGSALVKFIVLKGLDMDPVTALAEVDALTLSIVDTDVETGVTYYYRVVAVTAAGEGERSVVVSGSPRGPPGAPTGLTATAGPDGVSLSWTAPTSDGGMAITGYNVSRGTSEGSVSFLATLGDLTGYLDPGVLPGVTYYYAVTAINGLGEGAASPIASVDVPAVVPGMPLNVTVEVDGTTVVITWNAPSADGGSPITGYYIVRGTSEDALEKVGEVGAVLNFTDEGLERGKTYYYAVLAINDAGQSDISEVVQAKVDKKKGDGPGFGSLVALLAIATALAAAHASGGRRLRGR